MMAAGNLASFSVPASRVWNVCMLAHVDHGKSALSDSLISANGIISVRSAGKVRYMDSREDEQRRGITMKSSSIALGHRTADDAPLNIVNLIDSPGHVDFSGEVEAALRICDGAVVVVDVVEGVCVQTVTVLKAALEHALRPILVLNKIDRLFGELHLDPSEAYQHITNILAQVNVIMGVRQVEEMMAAAALGETEGGSEWQLDGDTDIASDKAVSGYFSPELGNVVFASALDGWAFRIIDFARLFSKKFGISQKVLNKTLWGNYFLQQKSKRIVKRKFTGLKSKGKPMFVQFIMASIHAIYDSILGSQHDYELAVQKRENFVQKLGLKVTARDIKHRDASTALQAIMNAWLPAARCLIETVVEMLPSAAKAQAQKERLWSLWPNLDSGITESEDHDLRDAIRSVRAAYHLQHQAISTCDPEGPMVGYVVKMVDGDPKSNGQRINIRTPKTREDLKALKEDALTSDANHASEDAHPMIAFARVLSGTLQVGDSVYVYSPKYEVRADGSYDHSTVSNATVTGLYLLMGRGMDSITSVSAGTVVGIAGLEEAVLKTATVSSLPPGTCLPAGHSSATSLGLEREAVVRVAVEPHLPGDVGKLQAALRRLNQADPAVETLITAKGENVVAANGELHLERCLKDLRERFAKDIRIHVSKPIVSYRETVSGGISPNVTMPDASINEAEGAFGSNVDQSQSNNQGDIAASWTMQVETESEPQEYASSTHIHHGRFVKVGNESVSFRVTAAPLPAEIANVLDNASGMLRLLDSKDLSRSLTLNKLREDIDNALKQHANEHGSRKQTPTDIVSFWKDVIFPRIWSSGPKQFGPNLLIGPYQSKTKSTVARELFGDTRELSMAETRIARELEKAIVTGFQMATRSGPLCEEPMHGVAVLVDKIQLPPEVNLAENLDSFGEGESGEEERYDAEQGAEEEAASRKSISGLVIGFMKEAVRQSCMYGNARLMEGTLHVDIAVPGEALGKTYTVIGQRRGRVLNEDMKEGMNVFGIEAYLPVQDSFGFTEVLRKQTSGFAVPQMVFSHWECIEMDPFWFPQTEEELEDLGASDMTAESNNLARKLINGVRRRKGLKVEEKIVENAEKQRTLSRKK